MKKILFSALVLGATAVSAQIKTDAGTFTKPTTGDIIMEVNMSPSVTGGGIFALQGFGSGLDLLGVKARKFKSDKKALRAIANLSVYNSGVEGADTDFSLGLGIGVENHMKGAERLSTYWGYEGKLGFVQSGEKIVLDEFGDIDETKSSLGKTTFGLSANLFTGFDYYIMPNIYLGAEVSYGIGILNSKEDFEGSKATTSFGIAPGITPTFRLGWRF